MLWCSVHAVFTSTCLLELLDAEYLRETNISFTVFCSLDAVKKAPNKKETRIKMEIVEVLQQACYLRQRSGCFDLVFVG